MKTNNILIYRDIMLPPSETFILAQGEGLSRFSPFYVGARKVNGIEVPLEKSYFINSGGVFGKFQELFFKLFDIVTSKQMENFNKLKPLLIHAHFGPDGVFALNIAKAICIPLIVTFHGYDATMKDDFFRNSYFIHRKYLKQRECLFKHCSIFIAVSDFIRQKLLELGVPEDKVLVHYIGIDINKFKPLVQISREPIILFVGRLVEKKGCTFLIQAMKDVQLSFPNVELVIIGDGPLRKELEHEAKSNLKKYRFLGTQPSNVVLDWMNRAKIFSVPSITAELGDAEGFGIVFAEAQAMGVPVVSFSSGGIPEAVANGETGFLLPEKDWQGLANKISLLLTDEYLWKKMSRNGQKRVRELFNLEAQTRKLENIYATVIEKSTRGIT